MHSLHPSSRSTYHACLRLLLRLCRKCRDVRRAQHLALELHLRWNLPQPPCSRRSRCPRLELARLPKLIPLGLPSLRLITISAAAAAPRRRAARRRQQQAASAAGAAGGGSHDQPRRALCSTALSTTTITYHHTPHLDSATSSSLVRTNSIASADQKTSRHCSSCSLWSSSACVHAMLCACVALALLLLLQPPCCWLAESSSSSTPYWATTLDPRLDSPISLRQFLSVLAAG